MKRSNWLNELRDTLGNRRARRKKRRPAATRRIKFEPLEERTLLAVLTVNSPLDNTIPDDGLVTLREAIIAGADTVEFAPSVSGTIALSLGELMVTSSVTINGPGSNVLTIDAQDQSRVFNITATSGSFLVRGLTLTNGNGSGDGGAIRSSWNLTVENSSIIGNASGDRGGGIYCDRQLILTNCTFLENTSVGAGGGVFNGNDALLIASSTISGNRTLGMSASGGGFYSRGSAYLTDCTVSNNHATGSGGGGLGTGYGRVKLTDCIVTGNEATGSGGGIACGSEVTVVDSTISDNRAGYLGGGINAGNGWRDTAFASRITNSTFTNNTTDGSGGGFAAGNAIVTNCTITGNSAGMSGGGFMLRGRSRADNLPGALTGSNVSGNSALVSGGGIQVALNINVEHSVISGNTGGGIFSTGKNPNSPESHLSINSSTISGNTRTGPGAGIFIYSGNLMLNFSTVDANSSMAGGGGIYARQAVTVESSTISGNTAAMNGGGIYWIFRPNTPPPPFAAGLSIHNSTITNNRASSGAGGGIFKSHANIDIAESLVAGNLAGGGNPDLQPGAGVLNVHFSLIGDGAGTSLTEAHSPDANGNLIGSSAGSGIINPRLAPLGSNGGPTRTHAFLNGSPAIDAIPVNSEPFPVHDYRLNGMLTDAVGGPNLASLGGSLTATGYNFGPNQGLRLASPSINPAQYSIELVFSWTNLSAGLQKIIDFDNLTSNTGLYTAGNGLQFVNGPVVSSLFAPNEIARLVLTRDDATNIVRAYVNGAEVWNFIDDAGLAVFDGPDRVIRFFQDDVVSGQSEAQGGFVDSIRIYNSVLSAAQVAGLTGPLVVPSSDQRGFPRVKDGDGIGGAQMDMGAYEMQAPLPPPSLDYGDAPDSAAGVAPSNYNTTASDNGPSHTVVTGLRLGANVDADSGSLQNAAANADDVNAALPDDEDGVSDPAADLVLTIGAQPTVNVRVTNTTGSAATLYGWMDYNANGVFDNVTERASVAVPSGTNSGSVTLVFPAVPPGFIGTTYARFRLSSDIAAANPTGAAANGEVEDYRVTINRPATAMADPAKTKKIASGTGGEPTLANGDMFGSAMAALGDLDGDGIEDMAVGAPSQTGSGSAGAVFVQFMNADGTVKSSQRIASGVGGGPALAAGDYFGHAVAAIGDLNGDGITDIAVGADKDDIGGYNRGAVYVLFLNANGTVKGSQKIAHGFGGGPTLANSDRFGSSIASLGDLDGDGIADLAVGAAGDDTGGSYRGAVHVLFMNANGTVKNSPKIASGVGGGPVLADVDVFGVSVAALGDLDGDRVSDLAVGAMFDDTGGVGRGAVHVLFMNSSGTVKASQKIASGVGGGPVLGNGEYFGRSVASLGDVDGDGVTDIAVGAYRDDTGGIDRGALHIVLLNANGTVKQSTKIASGTGGGPSLLNDGRFGSGVAALGDLDGDGIIELAVGAETDSTGGVARGAVYVLSLTGMNTAPVFTSPAQVSVPENTTTVQTVTAVDTEAPPQTISYSIAGGTDQAKFSITSGGILSFITPPNFEAPADANGDNTYVVIVGASDGSLSSLQAIVVTVTPVNDNSPVFTSPAAATVLEGTTPVTTVTATDADLPAQAIALSLWGGADIAKFALTNGQLAFLTPPDFESPGDANGDSIYEIVVQADDGNGRATLQTILVTVVGPPADYGDAPDTTTGTGTGNYNTRAADDGPRHTIVPGLRIGANVDGESGTLQTGAANADDVDAALPDDEDGVANPASDLALTIGAQPTVNVRVTNTTGALATLYGWIDYNANGVFENGTEQASIAVPGDTNNGIVTLVFPTVPTGYFGITYGRFRLSTDAAAANPTGTAANGEVEDYRVTIVNRSDPTPDNSKTTLIPAQGGQDNFGVSVASIGDLDGDGVADLAVGKTLGSFQDSAGGIDILFMNANGTVRGRQQINAGGLSPFVQYNSFGRSIAPIGDLDGDGVTDLVVGASGFIAGGARPGVIQVLFLNMNGSIKRRTSITSGFGGGPILGDQEEFGISVTSLGDLDGDGVNDIAVGSRGNVYVLFMNADGTAKTHQRIGGLTGYAVAAIGDLDGDGVTDLAASAQGAGGTGAVHVVFLKADGTTKNTQQIGNGIGGGPPLLSGEEFGSSLASLGDLDGDGVTDLVVGALRDNPFSPLSQHGRGAVYFLLLNSNGTVKSSRKFTNPNPTGFGNPFSFGRAVTTLGDLDGDGLTDVAVGANQYSSPGDFAGALQVFFLKPFNSPPEFTSPMEVSVAENSSTVMTVSASDADLPPQTVTLSIAGGADQSKFTITAAGELSFSAPPNFEVPTDANGDSVYVVTVQANDGNSGIATQTISVTVTPVNDNAPVFTSPDAVSVLENTTSVLTVAATDADLPAQTVTYSIVGGADQAKFNITMGGALSFKSPPDFEAPTDSNGDNIYIVIVQASDSSLTNLQAILVTVTSTSQVPLAGDYNNNGAVDLADYIVWRYALGTSVVLPNDPTPGMVSQADYDLWRANFGRTGAAGAGSVEQGAGSLERGAENAISGRNGSADPRPLDSLRPLLATASLRPGGEVREGRNVYRPSSRSAIAAASSRDDALVAWLAAEAAELRGESRAVGKDRQQFDGDDFDAAGEPVDALDLAFATL